MRFYWPLRSLFAYVSATRVIYRLILAVFVVVVLVDLPGVVGWIADNHKHIRLPLFFNALGVLGCEQRQLSSFREFKPINEAEALKRMIDARRLIKFVFNVH